MELRAAECVVRTYHRDDAGSLARHADNRRIWINLRDRFPHPYRVEDAVDFIEFALRAPIPLNFAIDIDGMAVGGIGLQPGEDIERCGAELGYWLGEEFWGRGVTTAAVRLVTDYALSERGLQRVFALPFVRNVASARVLEKAGYLREGHLRRSVIKDGELLDQYIYARVRE